MHCPECAANILDGSRFCGVCGHRLDAPMSQAPASPGGHAISAPRHPSSEPPHLNSPTPSALELPVSPGARAVRMVALFALDMVLLVIGIAFMLSYMDSRAQARSASSRIPRAHEQALDPPAPVEPTAPVADLEKTSLQQQVEAHVTRNHEAIQACQTQAAAGSGAPLAGRLDIGFTVDASGQVVRAQAVANDTGSEVLARCVLGLFKGWTFNEKPGRAQLDLMWPLRFKAPK